MKNKKGMTLIELIAGMMMFAIIAITVSSILAPMLTVYARANDLAECNTLVDDIANIIIKDLREATPKDDGTDPVTFSIDPGNLPTLSIYIEGRTITYTIGTDVTRSTNGVLLRNGTVVLSKEYYKNKSVNFSVAAPVVGGTGTYKLNVEVWSDKKSEKMIDRTYDVRPLVLGQT